MNELPARPPAHSNLPGALPGYFPPVHGALLLISSSRIGNHSTISYRYACKTLVRLNISPLVSCSLVNELLARLSAHANLLGTLLGYFPHVNIALPLTYSSRIRHYSTILPLHIQHLDSLEYLSFGVLFARERATCTPPSACQPTGSFTRLLLIRPRRITTDLQFSDDRPSQHNLIPLCMQDLGSLDYLPFGVLFARERATRTAFSACQPTGGFARLLPTRPRRISADLQFSDRPPQQNLIPLRMQDLDSHEHFRFGVLFSRARATKRIPAHVNLPATLLGYFPHVHGTLLSTYNSRTGHYSTVSYRQL